jgi:hypothetical protein
MDASCGCHAERVAAWGSGSTRYGWLEEKFQPAQVRRAEGAAGSGSAKLFSARRDPVRISA